MAVTVMKAGSTILRELSRARAAIRREDLNPEQFAELRGIVQALSWALGSNAMAPVKAMSLPPAPKK